MLQNVEGVVLRTRSYGETNKIVTIFSKSLGKFSGVARGANRPKSRMAAVTQPFIYGNFLVYFTRGLSTIQQGEIVHSYRYLRDDIIKTAYVAYMMELIDKLVEERKPVASLYDELHKTLNWMEAWQGDDSYLEIPTMMFEFKIFTYAGISPVVDHCANCQGEFKQYRGFSLQQGGLLCEGCFPRDEQAIQLSPKLAKLLYIFKYMSIERLGNISLQDKNIKLMRQIIDAYYDAYGGYYIKSRNFLRQLDYLK